MAKSKTQARKQDPVVSLVVGLALLGVSYVFISWAIDSGVLMWYILTFVALYYGVVYLKKFIRLQFFNNDKKRAAKKA